MRRRELFKMLAAAAIAPFLPKLSFAKPEPRHSLSWIEDEFPGVKVFDVAGQVIFPVYGAMYVPMTVETAYLYVGSPHAFNGCILVRPSPTPPDCQTAWHIVDDPGGSCASIEWIKGVEWKHPNMPTGLRDCLRRAAHSLLHGGYKYEATTFPYETGTYGEITRSPYPGRLTTPTVDFASEPLTPELLRQMSDDMITAWENFGIKEPSFGGRMISKDRHRIHTTFITRKGYTTVKI